MNLPHRFGQGSVMLPRYVARQLLLSGQVGFAQSYSSRMNLQVMRLPLVNRPTRSRSLLVGRFSLFSHGSPPKFQ
ncbi:hypothetical protein ASD97_08995 [Streptomyces sp. Root63]|nr:hypothetical protein ASD97_08995 [Streptomyces sp. Root63]